MADEAKTPVAIRITRPYGSEEEFLARELDTLTRTSIVLLGAQQRPQGVVLRFELALASGAPLVRGEGRVVAFKENAFEDLAGLTLRFTRLDARSKALIDRAAAMRDGRSRPPPPVAEAAPAHPAVASPRPAAASPRPPTAPPPRPPARSPTAPPVRPTPPRTPSAPPLAPQAAPLELDLEATRAEVPAAKVRSDRPPPLPPRAQTRPPSAPHRSSTPPLAPRVAPPPPEAPVESLDLESTHAEGPQSKRTSERPPVEAAPAAPSAPRDPLPSSPRDPLPSSPRDPLPSSPRDPLPSSPDRDALLARLRERRRSLDEDTIRALLAKKR